MLCGDLCGLVRQAFGIRMRRRWHSAPDDSGAGWIACNEYGQPIEKWAGTKEYFVSDDCDSCLIDADAWYKEIGL